MRGVSKLYKKGKTNQFKNYSDVLKFYHKHRREPLMPITVCRTCVDRNKDSWPVCYTCGNEVEDNHWRSDSDLVLEFGDAFWEDYYENQY